MASVSDSGNNSASFQIEVPVQCKPVRRSSIFKPNAPEPSFRYNDEIFPPDYRNKLIQENLKWKEAYTNSESEYTESRKKAQNKVQQAPSIDFSPYENYLRKAEDFCCQVNNVAEMHENAINFRNMRRRELEKLVESTSVQIHERLNK